MYRCLVSVAFRQRNKLSLVCGCWVPTWNFLCQEVSPCEPDEIQPGPMQAGSCTWVRAAPAINTGWGVRGLRAALPRMPRKPTAPWAASKAVWPAGWGRGFCPGSLPLWDLTWSAAPSPGVLSTGETHTVGGSQEKGHILQHVQGDVGWDSEQPDLGKDVPTHCRGLELVNP